MKKTYETPVVEKVEFQYEEQVVASVGEGCLNQIIHTETVSGSNQCQTKPENYRPLS